MLLTIVIEIQWLTHASVARPAEVFYSGQFNQTSFFNIDFLAMAYMLIFLIVSFPASYIIDTYGIKKGLSFGAILVVIFSLVKAIFAQSFMGIVIAQIGLAVAQPFILNAVTAVTVRWFPLNERGMAAGFSALAQYIGIIIAMLVTPLMIGTNPDLENYGAGFEKMLWIYGIISVIAAFALLIFIREKPKNIKFNKEERHNFFTGLGHIVKQRDGIVTIFLFLLGLRIFNAVSAMTDSIAEHIGVKDSDGLIGGLMLIGGIIGAIIIPILSDKYRKRKLFLVICMSGMIPGIFGLAFANHLSSDPTTIYNIALTASFVLGFFVMSAGPIGFQYAAEVSYPAPESTSQGILLWIGQITGLIFVTGMSINNNENLGLFMIVFSILTLISLIGVLLLRESKMIQNEDI
ncbi:MAG: MFS transporter [Bacteroidota bacterium]